jgi:hypothetical protein
MNGSNICRAEVRDVEAIRPLNQTWGGSGRGYVVLLAVFCCLTPSLQAERLPLNPAQLLEEAELVVVGRIVDLQIKTERSHVETGFGNSDWAIDLTLQITNVEKGRFEGDTIVARCFRIKSRKSVWELMTPSGNRPIPAPGTMVRVHLYQRDHRWRVVYPNGLVDPQGATALPDAEAVPSLRVEVSRTGCRSNAGGPWACSLPCPCSWVG